MWRDNHFEEGVTVNSPSATSIVPKTLKMWTFSVQDYVLLAIQSVRNIFATRPYFTDLVKQMDVIGVGSLRIVVVALVCVGGVVVPSIAWRELDRCLANYPLKS